MTEDIAIHLSAINKSFKVPHEKHNSLKSAAVDMFRSKKYTKFKALDDISFDIKKGEFFGIVGKNGSGKSTLLKIIANIYQPTSGNVSINGSLAPFIELGVGFNPELTGRENVFLSGTILGMTRKKIENIYEEIVEFAEIGEFMDQKLKNFSSGMQVRLAFSIAVRAESDILLIDEVLAVGDAAFQAKCLNYFEELKRKKKTVVFVSHDMDAVTQFCDRVVLITNGEIDMIGNAESVSSKYLLQNQPKTLLQKKIDSEYITKVLVLNNKKQRQNTFSVHEDILISLNITKGLDIKNVGVAILRNDGTYCYGTNTLIDRYNIGDSNKVILKIHKPNLARGTYYVNVNAFSTTDQYPIEFIEEAATFNIKDGSRRQGIQLLDSSWDRESRS